MDNEFENIVPWNGANDTGRDVRLKWQRNFERIKANFEEVLKLLGEVDVEKLAKYFIRKDQDDQTDHLVKFLAGLEVGEFIDSLSAGKGTKLFSDGRGQMNILELRKQIQIGEAILFWDDTNKGIGVKRASSPASEDGTGEVKENEIGIYSLGWMSAKGIDKGEEEQSLLVELVEDQFVAVDLLAEALGEHPKLQPCGVEDGVRAEARCGEGSAYIGIDDLAAGEVRSVVDGDELQVVGVVLHVLAVGLDVHIEVPVVAHRDGDLVCLAACVHFDDYCRRHRITSNRIVWN